MDDWIVILIFISGFILGWIGGVKWGEWQWVHCAKNNLVMRISKKYLYEVKPITEDKV